MQPEYRKQSMSAGWHDPEVEELKKRVVDDLFVAEMAIDEYRKMLASLHITDYEFETEKLEPLRHRIFVGAPGEVCESCGGSGRKK